MGAAGWWQGPDRGGVRLVRAWCLPLAGGGPPQHPRLPLVSGRPERCDGECEVCGRWPTPSRAGVSCRRPRPRAAALALGPVAGTGGCTQAEPPAASLPLLCDGMASGSTRPGQGRPPCGLDVAGLHRVTAAASRILAGQLPPGTGTVGRDAALRASWSAAIVMTAPVRMSSSGSPGKLAAAGGRGPVPDATLYPHRETSKFFPEFGNLLRWSAGPS
jgi:hypothetical protein